MTSNYNGHNDEAADRADASPDRDDLIGFEDTEFYPAEFKEADQAEMDRNYADDMERDAKAHSRAEDYGI